MSDNQNFTNEVALIDQAIKQQKDDIVAEITDPRWDIWIDYRALNGTRIDYDEATKTETIKKMPMEELAGKLGVSRQTLYDWERLIPDFWNKVRARKAELASQRRLSFMEDKFFLHAMTWKNWEISKTWLQQNNPDWKDPKQKIDVEAGKSMIDLFRQLEAEQKNSTTIIEAQVTTSEPDQSNARAV